VTRKSTRSVLVAAAITVVATTVVSGCQWRGLNSLPLPGTAGYGDGSYVIQAELPDVVSIQQNSRVRVGDVTVGNVTGISVQNWHALVTMRLDGDVHLPANSTAKVGQTSLLGSMHVELAAPTGTAPQGQLKNGSLIPLSAASAYPSTEQTLASVSMLLNGGGLGQLQEINQAFAKALSGREGDARSLLTQVDTFIDQANAQTDDIVAATDKLNGLVKQFADKKDVLDGALKTIPTAVGILNDERRNIADAVVSLGRFSAVAKTTIDESGQALVNNLRNLAPVFESLANAGPALTRSLSELSTFPWIKEYLPNWMRGDYWNIDLVLDLTKSRLDSALFTGTQFEGRLTAWEIAAGRTVGILPSPATAGSPLTFPYHPNSY
jgi:phospholipid/cholesterol/gamma-HCH transport system substrate-binding protein